MTLRVLLPLLVSASFLSLGCGGDVEASCKDYCAEANKCEGIEIDCDEQCA